MVGGPWLRLAYALVLYRRWQDAAEAAHKAVAGRRNAPWEVWTMAADMLVRAGEPEAAVTLLRRALAQNPQCRPMTRGVLGRALLLAGHSRSAIMARAAGPGQAHASSSLTRSGATGRGTRLSTVCEALAAAVGASTVLAGVNLSRHEAYQHLVARGFRTAVQGVAMHRDNEPGYCRPGVFVIDDWR